MATFRQPSAVRRWAVSGVTAKLATARRAVICTKGFSSLTRLAASRNISYALPRGLKDFRKVSGADSAPPTGPQINGTGNRGRKLGSQ